LCLTGSRRKLGVFIYLDFDGVLHPDSVYTQKDKLNPVVLRGPGELFMHSHILNGALAYYPDAKIILSTNWVKALGFELTLKLMPTRLAEKVVGSTASLLHAGWEGPASNVSRFHQIYSHVRQNNITQWLAIDDLHSGSEKWPENMLHRLVLTDQALGLGSEEAKADLNTKLMEIEYP